MHNTDTVTRVMPGLKVVHMLDSDFMPEEVLHDFVWLDSSIQLL